MKNVHSTHPSPHLGGLQGGKNVLTLLIDGGDTEELQTEVEYSTPPETMEIYNELMGEAPYLSDTVVSTSIEKEEVLPNAMIRDVMVANPKSAKSDVLLNKLDDRTDPMPDYMKAQILQGKSIISIREETEASIIQLRNQKTYLLDRIIKHYRNDTLLSSTIADSIICIFEEQDELHYEYKIAFEYLTIGDSLNTNLYLDSIPLKYNLDANEMTQHGYYEDFVEIVLDLNAQGKTWFEADSNQISELYTLYYNSDKGLKERIRNLLIAIDTLTYKELYIFPDVNKSIEAMEEYEKLMESKQPEYLHLFPNPASDYITIHYELENLNNGYIRITDMSGNNTARFNVEKEEDQIIVDTRDWKPGIYLATLFCNNRLVESKKFTLAK